MIAGLPEGTDTISGRPGQGSGSTLGQPQLNRRRPGWPYQGGIGAAADWDGQPDCGVPAGRPGVFIAEAPGPDLILPGLILPGLILPGLIRRA